MVVKLSLGDLGMRIKEKIQSKKLLFNRQTHPEEYHEKREKQRITGDIGVWDRGSTRERGVCVKKRTLRHRLGWGSSKNKFLALWSGEVGEEKVSCRSQTLQKRSFSLSHSPSPPLPSWFRDLVVRHALPILGPRGTPLGSRFPKFWSRSWVRGT